MPLAMESDIVIVSSNNQFKMVNKLKHQIIGQIEVTLGKLKGWMFNIKINFMEKLQKRLKMGNRSVNWKQEYLQNMIFLNKVSAKFPDTDQKLSSLSLIEEGPIKKIRMANLSIIGSHIVNGVAKIHSDLLKTLQEQFSLVVKLLQDIQMLRESSSQQIQLLKLKLIKYIKIKLPGLKWHSRTRSDLENLVEIELYMNMLNQFDIHSLMYRKITPIDVPQQTANRQDRFKLQNDSYIYKKVQNHQIINLQKYLNQSSYQYLKENPAIYNIENIFPFKQQCKNLIIMKYK